jgi:hypothetical protein
MKIFFAYILFSCDDNYSQTVPMQRNCMCADVNGSLDQGKLLYRIHIETTPVAGEKITQ